MLFGDKKNSLFPKLDDLKQDTLYYMDKQYITIVNGFVP